MSPPPKFFFFLIFFCSCFSRTHSQNNKWILGEWKGTGVIPGSDYSTVFTRILKIKIENKNRFSGLLIQQTMDNKNIRIEKEISGTIFNDQIRMSTGRTLYQKQPQNGFWADCSACKMNSTRISVSSDSLILTHETRLCGNYCDGYATYYKALADFDTATQRELVHLFGSPLLEKIFKPVTARINYVPTPAISHATDKELSRKNKTIATYHVPGPDIKIELFDNGVIDGDTVTVYHNKQKIIDSKALGTKPIVLTVRGDAQNRVHEFILVADNTGRVPPNTALMRITAGTKTYELFASTNLQENASVIIIYDGQ